MLKTKPDQLGQAAKKVKKRTSKVLTVMAIILFLVGATMFLYPYYFGWQSEKIVTSTIEEYDKGIESLKKDKSAPLDRLYSDVLNYNKSIYDSEQSNLKDTEAYQKSLFNLKDYGLNSEVFGYIAIPVLELKLPIYMGATKQNITSPAQNPKG